MGIPLFVHAQTIQQTPHVTICELPCTIPLRPELAGPIPGTARRIEVAAEDCHFSAVNVKTRSTQCESRVTVQTNAAFQLQWTLAPITHAQTSLHQLDTHYRIEPTNGDQGAVDVTLEANSAPRITTTPVWLPGVSGTTATYRIIATATFPTKNPFPRAGSYETHINISIASSAYGTH